MGPLGRVRMPLGCLAGFCSFLGPTPTPHRTYRARTLRKSRPYVLLSGRPKWFHEAFQHGSCGTMVPASHFSGSQTAPRRSKTTPREPLRGPRAYKDAPRGVQKAPGGPQEDPRGSQEALLEAPGRPKTLKNHGFFNVFCLWTAQGPRSHKSTPSGLKRPPRRPPGALQGPQDGSKTAQDRPKTAPGQSRDGRRAPRAAPDRPQGGPRRPYKFAQTGPNVFHNLSQERSGGTKRPPKQLQGAPGALRALLWGRFVPPFLS